MTEYEFTVVIEQDEDGVYIATAPALRGCHSFGYTEQEALAMVKEAIELYVEDLLQSGEPIPQEVGSAKVRIPVPA